MYNPHRVERSPKPEESSPEKLYLQNNRRLIKDYHFLFLNEKKGAVNPVAKVSYKEFLDAGVYGPDEINNDIIRANKLAETFNERSKAEGEDFIFAVAKIAESIVSRGIDQFGWLGSKIIGVRRTTHFDDFYNHVDAITAYKSGLSGTELDYLGLGFDVTFTSLSGRGAAKKFDVVREQLDRFKLADVKYNNLGPRMGAISLPLTIIHLKPAEIIHTANLFVDMEGAGQILNKPKAEAEQEKFRNSIKTLDLQHIVLQQLKDQLSVYEQYLKSKKAVAADVAKQDFAVAVLESSHNFVESVIAEKTAHREAVMSSNRFNNDFEAEIGWRLEPLHERLKQTFGFRP